MGVFSKMFRGLSADEGELRIAEAGRWAAETPGVTPIGHAVTRQVVKVGGVVERLRIRPQKGVPAIEAMLSDGTGTCTAVWLGRRSIKGLTLGRRMLIEGRLAERDGERAIMNPAFEFADHRQIEARLKK